jgi:DNA adenine methylase
MKTILKWPGGKEKELSIIRENLPTYTGRFIEPFVGGGAVFFDINNHTCSINDKSSELINLYSCVKQRTPDFLSYLQLIYDEFRGIDKIIEENPNEILNLYHSKISIDEFLKNHEHLFSQMAKDYNQVFIQEIKRNLKSKINRSQKLEKENGEIPNKDRLDNIEASLKSAYYMYIRYLQNKPNQLSLGQLAAVFFFIREYCYSSMFRYNEKGEFNVPYGGISYNRKDFQKKINYILSDEMRLKLSNTEMNNLDFEEYIDGQNLTENDFIFLDPPYDSDFSTYAQNVFGKDEQIRLCECLKRTKAKIMLIIKNTDFIYDLYKNDFKISVFDKKYLVSFMNRNEKDVKHLMITNY